MPIELVASREDLLAATLYKYLEQSIHRHVSHTLYPYGNGAFMHHVIAAKFIYNSYFRESVAVGANYHIRPRRLLTSPAEIMKFSRSCPTYASLHYATAMQIAH